MSKKDTLYTGKTQLQKKIIMKNKHIVSNSHRKNNAAKQNSEKAELSFRQSISDAGCSKKTIDEVLKWYCES